MNAYEVSPTRQKALSRDLAGKAIGDKKLRAEGKIDKAKGAAHETMGNVKDAAQETSKTKGRG